MKKLIALILVGIMAATALVGCSSEKEYSNPYSSMTVEEIAALLDFEDSYKGIEISQKELNKMWEEQFESSKSSLLTAWAENITASSENKPALKDGDTANIDYEGILDGETKPFEGGSAKGTDLKLGSDTFIDGFEDGLIGKKVGDTVELKLTFPKDYKNKELQNKKVTFTVKINSAKSVPAYDDALIKKAFADNEESLLKYKTVAEYEDAYRKDLYSSLAFEEYANATKVLTFPNDIINDEYSTLMDTYIALAKQAGTTLESFVTSYYAYMYIGAMYSSLGDFQNAMKKQAAAQVKSSLLVYYVYNSNKDAIDSKVESDTDRILIKYAESAGFDSIEQLKENYGEETLKDLVLEQLVYEYIGEQAVVVDDVKETATPTPTATAAPTATPTATADAE